MSGVTVVNWYSSIILDSFPKMFSPLVDDLSHLKDNEVEDKILELSKKYFVAQRLGKTEMLTQLATFVIMYKQEMSKRNAIRLNQQLDGDLGQLINVD
jgi:hypothetical protein